jgi:hypothetical protein
MLDITTSEWVIESAQANKELLPFAAPLQGAVYYVDITAADSNTGDVSCRIGFHATAIPEYTPDGGRVDNMAYSHGGIIPGGGAVKNNGGQPITIGPAGASLRLECSAPTGGSLRVLIGWKQIDQTT